MYDQYGSRATLDVIESTAGITTVTLKNALSKRDKREQKQQEERIELPPLDQFAIDLYKNLSDLREQAEQDDLLYDSVEEDISRVVTIMRGVLSQLPSRERDFVKEFMKNVVGVLKEVLL